MKNLSEVYKMRVEKRTCNIGEYLPLKRRLEKNGYTVGIGRIHLEFVSKHATRYRAGKFGIKKCFQPYRLHFYIRFEAIYKPNLAGNGVATPSAFFVCPCSLRAMEIARSCYLSISIVWYGIFFFSHISFSRLVQVKMIICLFLYSVCRKFSIFSSLSSS